MFLIKLKPQFWHLKAPFVIIRQDLVMVWSHILEKTWVHTSVKFVVMNREMVKFWRNTWFNIHIKDVMSWKTNAMSVILGAPMNILWKCTCTEIILKLLCNFEAKEEDVLDNHTFTCEMFKCHDCQSTFNMLQGIKTHMRKEHNGNG